MSCGGAMAAASAACSRDGRLRIGDVIPDFTAKTTHGSLKFHRWARGSWTILFSHPAAFTPVCTSEIGWLAHMEPYLRDRGFKVAVHSCSSVTDQKLWAKDVMAYFNGQIQINFPLIGDPSREVAVTLGMVDPKLKDAKGLPLTSRTLFIIGPDARLEVLMNYPDFVGRNLSELKRICDALVLCQHDPVATPASWPANHANLKVGDRPMGGAVFLQPVLTDQQASSLFPDYVELDVPSNLAYLRMTHRKVPKVRPTGCLSGCGAGLLHCLDGMLSRGGGGEKELPETVAEQPRYRTPAMARLVNFGWGPGAAQKQPTSGMQCYSELYLKSQDGQLRKGDTVPDFEADTTRGRMSFHRWIQGKWVVLMTASRSYTPVSTTEIGTLALMQATFKAKGIELAILCPDSMYNLRAWQTDVEAHFEKTVRVGFPLIADPEQDVAAKFGTVDPGLKEATLPLLTPRTVFIIGPDQKLEFSMSYPSTVGFDVHEIFRVCDALQLTARESVATPANWPNNNPELTDNEGNSMKSAVFLLSTITQQDRDEFFPRCMDIGVPSQRNYMRLTQIETNGRLPACVGCISLNRAMADMPPSGT